ncbi:MAG: LLM class F420-dependent oxidoreductase [Acidimicrobiales bacterium]
MSDREDRALRLGILTPVLTLIESSHAAWERDGTIDDVARIARAGEALGYDHLTCSEHVAVPEAAVPLRGGRYWDPLATFGYLAASTSSIRLLTNVLVLGYHHPLEIAKRYGTLDRISGGRLVLGLGVGSLEEEFDLLDVPFEDRGVRADDHLRALRASMSHRIPSYDGTHYRFSGMVVDPCAVQERVPFWIGGRTARSLRRAVELGDGWCPFGLAPDAIQRMLVLARGGEAWTRRSTDFDIVLQTARPLDPGDDPNSAAAAARALRDAGATMLSLRLVHRSVDHYIEQLHAMADVVATL